MVYCLANFFLSQMIVLSCLTPKALPSHEVRSLRTVIATFSPVIKNIGLHLGQVQCPFLAGLPNVESHLQVFSILPQVYIRLVTYPTTKTSGQGLSSVFLAEEPFVL